MSLQNEVAALLEDVDGALGAAVVDLGSGLMLAVEHKVPYFSQSYTDAVAAAAVDMFRGKTITAVEKMLAAQRGEDMAYHMKEVQMSTDHTYHFMSIVPDKPDALLVLITKTTVNLGMGWSAVRAALKRIAPHCP